MYITQLRLHNFRNFSQIEIYPDNSFNLIYGANGAGKSSLLEAIHVLGFGRSFRTNKADNIINQNDLNIGASVFTKFSSENSKDAKLGFKREKSDGFTFNIDGEKSKRIGDIVRKIPVQIFTPQSSDLILGPPLQRRRFIDWLLFHVEHSFQKVNSSYNKALNQRNALLKSMQHKSIEEFKSQDLWSKYLVEYGETIDRLRKQFVSELNSELSALYDEFNPEIHVEIRYNQGWEKNSSLADVLHSKCEKDLFRGHTSSGPHKADLQLFVNQKNAAEFLSRGQLRVLVSLLLIAEVKLLKKKTEKNCIFLVDDISAELDENTREFFLDKAVESSSQLFVTAIEKQQLSFAEKYNNKKMFHVKHNQVFEE